ncbi:MAG: c-type cytochrome [Cyanobium sp.]
MTTARSLGEQDLSRCRRWAERLWSAAGWRRTALLLLVLVAMGLGAVAPLRAEAMPEDLRSADPATLVAGAQLFEAHCVGCHVGGGNVIRRGRTLKRNALERADLASPEAIARVAAAGIGQMGGYGAVLGEKGAEQVGAWVWQQALQDWPRPTRPQASPS